MDLRGSAADHKLSYKIKAGETASSGQIRADDKFGKFDPDAQPCYFELLKRKFRAIAAHAVESNPKPKWQVVWIGLDYSDGGHKQSFDMRRVV